MRKSTEGILRFYINAEWHCNEVAISMSKLCNAFKEECERGRLVKDETAIKGAERLWAACALIAETREKIQKGMEVLYNQAQVKKKRGSGMTEDEIMFKAEESKRAEAFFESLRKKTEEAEARMLEYQKQKKLRLLNLKRKPALTLEKWTKLVKDECMTGCCYPGMMSEYLETDEAKETIEGRYEEDILKYEDGEISWEQLTIGAVGSVAYCLHLMCE